MSAVTEPSVEVFCSYAHEDERLRKKFEPVIVGLRNRRNVKFWHDRNITAGADWSGEIDKHLDSADIVTLLVSFDFLASRYCYEKEMTRALEREARKELVIVPIIVRSCDWVDEPFARFQVLPEKGLPIESWQNQDEAWTNVSQGLKKTIAQILSQKAEKIKEMITAESITAVKPEPPGALTKEKWNEYLADAAEARKIYAQIMQDAEAFQIKRWLIEKDMQMMSKIGEINQDITLNKNKTADKSFNNMDAYIRE